VAFHWRVSEDLEPRVERYKSFDPDEGGRALDLSGPNRESHSHHLLRTLLLGLPFGKANHRTQLWPCLAMSISQREGQKCRFEVKTTEVEESDLAGSNNKIGLSVRGVGVDERLRVQMSRR
jgi:hypothetical protein